MKTKLLIIVLCLSFSITYGQNSDNVINKTQKQEFSKNSVGLDGGLLYALFFDGYGSSINYERLIYNRNNSITHLRTGVGYYVLGWQDGGYGGIQIPLTVNIISNKFSNNHFEIDLGGRAVFDIKNDGIDYSDEKVRLFPIVNIGYRYQNPKGGFIFKSLIGIDGITLGIGYAF